MSAAWWQPYQVESASKTNFYIRQNPVNHKVPLRGTCNVQLMDQAANLSEVLAWSFILKSVLRTANIYDVSMDNNDLVQISTNLICSRFVLIFARQGTHFPARARSHVFRIGTRHFEKKSRR
jgi:hypothetical protein